LREKKRQGGGDTRDASIKVEASLKAEFWGERDDVGFESKGYALHQKIDIYREESGRLRRLRKKELRTQGSRT